MYSIVSNESETSKLSDSYNKLYLKNSDCFMVVNTIKLGYFCKKIQLCS